MANNDKLTEKIEAPESRSRRKAVKTLVGGATALAAYHVLPVKWDTPIIEQVFLPAHAQTSGVAIYILNDPCTLTLISGNQNTSEAKVKVDGYVTPPTANLPVTITATPEGGTGGAVTFNTTTDAAGEFTGTLTVTGGPGMTRINVQTHIEGSDNDAVCALDLGISQPQQPTCGERDYLIPVSIDEISSSYLELRGLTQNNEWTADGTLGFRNVSEVDIERVVSYVYCDGSTNSSDPVLLSPGQSGGLAADTTNNISSITFTAYSVIN